MKILYLPHEIYNREFTSLLNLSKRLYKKSDYDYIILGSSFILFLLSKFNLVVPGIWHLKSAQSFLKDTLAKLHRRGFLFTLHNSESLCTFDSAARYDPFVNPSICCKFIHAIITSNDKENNFVSDFINKNCLKTNVVKLGNLRTANLKTLINNGYFDFYTHNIEKITNGKKYILYNSSAGLKYHYYNNYDKQKAKSHLTGLGILEDHVSDLLAWSDHQQLSFFCFLEFMRLFNNSNLSNEYIVVFRTHPSEDKSLFERVLSDYENLIINDSFSVIPWILNAKIIIGSTSTTLIESAYLRKPTISLLPEYDNKIYKLLLENDANNVSETAKSPTELFSLVQELSNESIISDTHYKRACFLVGDNDLVLNSFVKFYSNLAHETVVNNNLFNSFRMKSFIFIVSITEVLLKILCMLNYNPIKYVFKKAKYINRSDVSDSFIKNDVKFSLFNSLLLIKCK
jgi:surface carbohydrate biosynthesis protein